MGVLDYVAVAYVVYSDASVPQYSSRVTVHLCVNIEKVLLAMLAPALFRTKCHFMQTKTAIMAHTLLKETKYRKEKRKHFPCLHVSTENGFSEELFLGVFSVT